MRTDYTQTSEQIFLDMVNYHNRESLTEHGLYPLNGSDMVLGVPTAINNVRTSVVVTPKQTALYVGRFRFFYNRVSLNSLLLHDADTTFRVRIPGEYRLSEFISAINARWEINVGVRDYIDKTVVVEQYDATVVLEADPRSLVWVNNLALVITCGTVLSDNVLNRDLDGFGGLDLYGHVHNKDLDGFLGGDLADRISNRHLDGFTP